jgi:hypothetical protein
MGGDPAALRSGEHQISAMRTRWLTCRSSLEGDLRSSTAAVHERRVDLGLQDREWGAKLMACVVDEPALAFERRLELVR